jgi:hypothetical protein
MPYPGFESDNQRTLKREYLTMRTLPKYLFPVTFGLMFLVCYQVFADEPPISLSQTTGELLSTTLAQGAGDSIPANAEFCTHCYQQLQKDNHNCETLKGQDWQICREAASTAYRQCSQGC